MSDEPKKRGKDPEFMKMMRQKAAEKKAEQRKIKDAQKLKEKKEYESKLKEADAILNPQNVETQKETKEDTPIEKPVSKPSEPPAKPKEKDIDYKQEYYRTKLEMLKEQKTVKQVSQHTDKPLPHKLMKQELMHDINKTVMKELWKRHFGGDETPYD